MNTIDELLDDIFDGKRTGLYPEFSQWVRGSRRFKAFATFYRGKIRAKLKNVRDEEGMQDLRAELEAAVLLLSEDRFTLEYEKYAASKQRAPDFTVTFRTHTAFNLEVRRLRNQELDAGDTQAQEAKLLAVLCDKVGQMRPGTINILWLVAELAVSEADAVAATATLRGLAERKSDTFFVQRGFLGAGDFLKQYRRLSGILLRQSGGNQRWHNPLCTHKVPPDIANALLRLPSP